MPDQAKNIAIGLFVLAACAIVVFIILFLHPRTGDEAKVFHIRFSDIDKINVGSRVTFAGKSVGEVKEIREVRDSRTGHTDEDGNVYPYELTIVVDSGITLYSTDEVILRTSGLLGERSVSIIPIAPPIGVKPQLITKDIVVYAANAGSLEDTMKVFKSVAHKVNETLDEAINVFHEIKRDQVVENIAGAVKNVNDITGSLNHPQKWDEMLNNFHDFSKHIDHFAERLLKSWDAVDTALAEVNKTVANTTAITDDGKVIIAKVRKGEGTAGKILVSDDLYLRLVSVLNKVETIGDDVNHYGLLFQTDKGWQRLRARRMNLLSKLSSPQEFRNYFNDEVDQISTSLSRVSMVLEKTEQYPSAYPLIEDKEFSKVFAELLRRISGLEEELRMYNTQLVDTEVKKTELEPPAMNGTNCY